MKRYLKSFIPFLMVSILASACTSSPTAPSTLTVTLAANAADKGPGGEYLVGTSYYFHWACDGATWAELYSPTGSSGVHSSGKSDEIKVGHLWYPAVGQTMKFTISCGKDKKEYASKTILIRKK